MKTSAINSCSTILARSKTFLNTPVAKKAAVAVASLAAVAAVASVTFNNFFQNTSNPSQTDLMFTEAFPNVICNNTQCTNTSLISPGASPHIDLMFSQKLSNVFFNNTSCTNTSLINSSDTTIIHNQTVQPVLPPPLTASHQRVTDSSLPSHQEFSSITPSPSKARVRSITSQPLSRSLGSEIIANLANPALEKTNSKPLIFMDPPVGIDKFIQGAKSYVSTARDFIGNTADYAVTFGSSAWGAVSNFATDVALPFLQKTPKALADANKLGYELIFPKF